MLCQELCCRFTFFGIDQVYVYIFWYNFVSLKKGQNLIYFDIFKKIFLIIYIKKAFSDGSESFTFYEKMFKSAGYVLCYTLKLFLFK